MFNTEIIDCKNLGLGEIAQRATILLRGLNKLDWDPRNQNLGIDKLILINGDLVKMPYRFKKYSFHSGFAGGFKRIFAKELLFNNPRKAIKRTIWGHLPKNNLGRKLLKKIRIFKNKDEIISN